jgi:3-oxoacyl-[acyl-carrier protein] reductase
VMAAAIDAFCHVDVLICNHARGGGDGRLGELDAAKLDGHYAVNTRSSILLAQAFAAQHDGRAGGRIVFMTSGQALGPMPGEIAYAAAKGALAAATLTIADELAVRGITVNAVNPGPVATAYFTDELRRRLAPMLPAGRPGAPDDPARLIAWLATDEARWITGQVINSEGGFARWRAGD